MKIKNYIYGAALAVTALAMGACSSIDENDRLIYVAPADVKKHVLVEDFTGQSCVNCPKAAEEIVKLQELYGEDNVIAVGIYGGDYGYSPISQGHQPWSLTTEEGNSYYSTWGVTAQPGCMVDRAGGRPFYNTAYLSAYVSAMIKNEPTVMISPTVSYSAAQKSGTLNVTISGLETLTDAKLQVWLVEDSITDMQYMRDGSVNNSYVHNHVFRKSVSAVNGDAINVVKEGSVSRSYTFSVDDAWKADKVSLVTFVFTADGVQQVEKTAITSK
jgi:hypothetical protein